VVENRTAPARFYGRLTHIEVKGDGPFKVEDGPPFTAARAKDRYGTEHSPS
jgi:hypothetical protein